MDDFFPERRRELSIDAGRELIARCLRAVERGDIKHFYPFVSADDPEIVLYVQVVK